MSRYEVYHKDKALAFGEDHAVGEYLQIWDLTAGYGRRPCDGNILVDEDVMFGGLTEKRMWRLITEHGFHLEELARAKAAQEEPRNV